VTLRVLYFTCTNVLSAVGVGFSRAKSRARLCCKSRVFDGRLICRIVVIIIVVVVACLSCDCVIQVQCRATHAPDAAVALRMCALAVRRGKAPNRHSSRAQTSVLGRSARDQPPPLPPKSSYMHDMAWHGMHKRGGRIHVVKAAQ
jgi:hypothetical protein